MAAASVGGGVGDGGDLTVREVHFLVHVYGREVEEEEEEVSSSGEREKEFAIAI